MNWDDLFRSFIALGIEKQGMQALFAKVLELNQSPGVGPNAMRLRPAMQNAQRRAGNLNRYTQALGRYDRAFQRDYPRPRTPVTPSPAPGIAIGEPTPGQPYNPTPETPVQKRPPNLPDFPQTPVLGRRPPPVRSTVPLSPLITGLSKPSRKK